VARTPARRRLLRRLEHAAKTTLYERSRLGARLNESGEWLLQHVKVALAEIRIGYEELARWRGKGEFLVTIGSLPMATDVLVPHAAARVLVMHPELHIGVKDGTYESLTRLLRNADVDFVVGPLRGDALAGDLEEEVLYVDRFVAVVRQGHPLLRGGRRASRIRGSARSPARRPMGCSSACSRRRACRCPPWRCARTARRWCARCCWPATMWRWLGYDPLKSFVPVAYVARVPNVLVVNAASPFRSLKDLVDAARAKPGLLTYSSGGNGSAAHITFEALKLKAKIFMATAPSPVRPP